MSQPGARLPSAASASTSAPSSSLSTAAASASASTSASSSASYVSVERRGEHAVLTMCREPVNSMNLDVWTQMLDALTQLEADRSCRGLILQSGLKKGQHLQP